MERERDMYTIKDVLALYLSKNKHIEYKIKSQEDKGVDNSIMTL